MEREEKINLIVSNENLAKQILKAINQSYGKKFIEDTLLDNQIQKKERHKRKKIMDYYNSQLIKYPYRKKKEIRVITALRFHISEKAVQYHITKSKS